MKEKMITSMNRKILIHSLPIVMAAMMMAACSYEDMAEITGDDTLEARTWQVSINAGPAETKAISIGGNNGQTLYTNWDPDDAVEVVKDGASVGTLHADVSAGNSAYATLTGTLTGTFAVNDEVTLYYHTAALDYTGQMGTLAGVSTNKSYLTATSTVKSVDGSGGFLSMSSAAFSPMQAYLELSFTDGTNPLSFTSLDIWADGGKLVKTKALDGTTTYATKAEPLTITPATATDKVFIALRDENGAANNYHFMATATNGKKYAYDGSKNLARGKYYKGTATTRITLDINSPDLGQVIGDDGKNYDYASLPDGVTAVARICYLARDHGLALAMADEGSMNWNTAVTTCAAHTPKFHNGTWKLANNDEWNVMFNAAGGSGNLRDSFSSVGGTDLVNDNYWSSWTSNTYALRYYFPASCWYTEDKNTDYIRARACLTFEFAAPAPAVGQVIGTDGLNYEYACLGGVTAVARICYLNGDHGLALALADEENISSWSVAKEKCETHTPTVPNCTWKLATKDEWDVMFNAAGGSTTLRNSFESVGGSNMQAQFGYWSATEQGTEAWRYSTDLESWFSSSKGVNNIGARACLAF